MMPGGGGRGDGGGVGVSTTSSGSQSNTIQQSTAGTSIQWEKKSILNATQHGRLSRLTEVWGDRGGGEPSASTLAEGTPSRVLHSLQELEQWCQAVLGSEGESSESKEGPETLARMRVEEIGRSALEVHRVSGLVAASLEDVRQMESLHGSVGALSLGLHRQTDEMVAQVTRLTDLADRIGVALAAFDDCDQVASALNVPTLTAHDPRFTRLLERLDGCQSFFSRHRNYLSSTDYERKVRELQLKAFGLARTALLDEFRSLTDSLRSRLDLHPYVVDFRKAGPRIQPLCLELEKRNGVPDIAAVLVEVQQCYFRARVQLLMPANEAVVAAIVRDSDLEGALRRGALHVAALCRQEVDLYHHFFASPSPPFFFVHEELGSILHKHLRPHIIRQHDIDQLCVLLDNLQTEILASAKGELSQVYSLAFGRITEDIRERLIFLAQSYVRDSIAGYAAQPQDLEYPEKLQSLEPTAASYASWYPTLERTLMLLSKLYLALDAPVFEGVAQEALTLCMASLADAARKLEARKGWVHAFLFLIRHLLILREQLSPFEVDFSVEQVVLDFSPLKSAWDRLLRAKLSFFSREGQRSWLDMMTNLQPNLQNLRLNSKKALERTLVSQIELFILRSIKLIEEPLVQAAELLRTNESSPKLAPETLHTSLLDAKARVAEHLDSHLRWIDLYIAHTANVSNRVNILRAYRDNTYVYFDRIIAWMEGKKTGEASESCAVAAATNSEKSPAEVEEVLEDGNKGQEINGKDGLKAVEGASEKPVSYASVLEDARSLRAAMDKTFSDHLQSDQ